MKLDAIPPFLPTRHLHCEVSVGTQRSQFVVLVDDTYGTDEGLEVMADQVIGQLREHFRNLLRTELRSKP